LGIQNAIKNRTNDGFWNYLIENHRLGSFNGANINGQPGVTEGALSNGLICGHVSLKSKLSFPKNNSIIFKRLIL